MKPENFIKGRGAQINSTNKFSINSLVYDEEFTYLEKDNFRSKKTKYLIENPKSILNKITSIDLPNTFSVNPYQGCEHGCIYCYARNTHEYYGYSAGLEFEQNILIKKNAPLLLEKEFIKKSWRPKTILFSGNTDCYQPAERKFEITRNLIMVCLKYRNPIAIITKNTLIIRDLDLLIKMAKMNLVHVIVSLTTLNENLRRKLEPRTVSGRKKLDLIKTLSSNNIPTGVNIAPIIPSLNDHEIPNLIKHASINGACSIAYTVVRLNGAIAHLFDDWVYQAYPNKAKKIISQIKELHNGKLNDSQFGRRMRGDGVLAEHIRQLFQLAKHKYMPDIDFPPYDFEAFQATGQMELF